MHSRLCILLMSASNAIEQSWTVFHLVSDWRTSQICRLSSRLNSRPLEMPLVKRSGRKLRVPPQVHLNMTLKITPRKRVISGNSFCQCLCSHRNVFLGLALLELGETELSEQVTTPSILWRWIHVTLLADILES